MDNIKHIFYINLSTRLDRKAHIEAQLNRVGFSAYERFNAVKVANGRVGCALSHIKCLELAKERGYPHVLICEDDTTFLQPDLFKMQLKAFFEHQQEHQQPWDVLLFAGNNVPPYIKMSEAYIRVSHCQTTTCYLVNGHYIETLLSHIREGTRQLMQEPTKHLLYAIDRYWLELQRRDLWFLITPLTVVQREDYSDIEGHMTNYAHLMLDLDKTELLKRINSKK
jgi:GR25 family glycosyltransferase involved in LPS biosynthesis